MYCVCHCSTGVYVLNPETNFDVILYVNMGALKMTDMKMQDMKLQDRNYSVNRD